MLSPFRLLCCAAMLLVSAATLRALTVDPGAPGVKAGLFSSVAIVGGRPAIAYSDNQQIEVKFVRALDASGKAWGEPVTVDNAPRSGFKVPIRIVNGNPAICYFDAFHLRVKYARATNAAGTAWGTPILLDIGGGLTTSYSLEVVDGKPAICCDGGFAGGVQFQRATDANGTAWSPPVMVDPTASQAQPCMTMVEGFPAIAYGAFGNIRYARATNAAGTAWSEPVNIPTQAFGLADGISLLVVNGRPALSFAGNSGGYRYLWYTQATDTTGTAWIAPLIVSTGDIAVDQTSLAVVNGKPAIGFHSNGLRYVQALDADGGSQKAWSPAVTADRQGDAGYNPSLLEVDGYPALVSHNATRGSLEFLRPTAESGGARWPVAMLVQSNSAFDFIRDDAEVTFGACEVGKKLPLRLSIMNGNSGSASLTNISVTLDGPDAAEFGFSVPLPVSTLPGGEYTEFEVEYRPVKGGVKSATLRIACMTEGEVHLSHEISLTASSLPGMVMINAAANHELPNGSTVLLPKAAPHSTKDFGFTIRNPGTADLEISGIAFEGPDAAEFSIVSPVPPLVPPGSSTPVLLRHITATGERKSVTLLVSNNLTGGQNPFRLSINLVPGTLDPGFRPVIFREVTSLALQGDGKILAGQDGALDRFLPDGAPDVSFFAPAISGGAVECLAVQKDGRILLGGGFTQVDGRPVPHLARLETDGSLDADFVPDVNNTVFCLSVQPDGRILAGGSFTTVGGSPRLRLVRLHPDGSRDAGFTAVSANTVRSLALAPDDSILVGGGPVITRHNPDGSIGASPVNFGIEVYCLALQADGRILAGGFGDPGGLKRFFANGQPEPSLFLSVGSQPLLETVPLANGKVLTSGDFNVFGGFPRRGIACVHADGSLDQGFIPVVNDFAGTPSVGRVAVQADGKVLLAGHFSRVDTADQQNLARLENDPASAELKTVGLSNVRWLRSGTAPEVRDVTFDAKPEGSPDWTRLGNAARIPGGWELSGLTLPTPGQIRAQAYAGGSVMESAAPILTALESWRLQYFHTPDNTGDAANDADPDHDGITNFTEFAFGLDPVDRSSNALPEFKHDGNAFSTTFTAPEGREDVQLYSAEWSASMQAGAWKVVLDTGAGGGHEFRVPGGRERIFVKFIARLP